MPRSTTRLYKRRARHLRVRKKVIGNLARPRLCVYRSLKQIYAQVIDDGSGRTLAAASSLKLKEPEKSKTEVAKLVGTKIAEQSKAAGISRVIFDRGGYKYHGRVKALAQAARDGGLEF